ncbi:hypothetical protein DL96DRAFT_1595194 [Flagelloscypha sp. PMI_526]|nr:hypothetical protein DL96DRAFT_1595194 [Flagelloscypha sp. PMI_526]
MPLVAVPQRVLLVFACVVGTRNLFVGQHRTWPPFLADVTLVEKLNTDSIGQKTPQTLARLNSFKHRKVKQHISHILISRLTIPLYKKSSTSSLLSMVSKTRCLFYF